MIAYIILVTIAFFICCGAIIILHTRATDKIIEMQDRRISELITRNDLLNESIARQSGHVYMNNQIKTQPSTGWYDIKDNQ